MKNKNNQYGLTLLEVILTLAILTIVGGIIWGVLFQGSSYSEKAMTKNQMQQEANNIITRLLKYHRTNDDYIIISKDCKITLKATTTEVLEHPQLCIESNPTGTTSIKPKVTDTPLTLTVSDKNEVSNKISVETLLFRLKSGDKDEANNQ